MNHKRTLSCFCLAMLCAAVSGCKEQSSDPLPQQTTTETAQNTAPVITEPFTADGLRFSAKSGFYPAAFSLSVTAENGAPVHYTADGSTPTAESPVLNGEIRIEDRSGAPALLAARTGISPEEPDAAYVPPSAPVDQATVIRAAAERTDGTLTPAVTCTYFIGYDGKADFYQQMKCLSLVTDEQNLFDPQTGIYVLGQTHDDWKQSAGYDPDTPAYAMPANYTQKGREWERAASLEIFENGQRTAAQGVGIRIHGGASRALPQKSFNIYARREYGGAKLRCDLFDGQVTAQSDGSPVTEFDSFMLRNGGNDAQYVRFRDRLNQTLVSDRAFLTQGMAPCILFVNGEFWGHYDITEHMDAAFVRSHCGIPKQDVCIVKKEEAEAGSDAGFADWEALRKWIGETDFSGQSAYDALYSRVDLTGFADYVCAELYINNANWGRSNSAMWKSEAIYPDNPYADGKWRFIMFDTDFSDGIYGTVNARDDALTRLRESGCFLGELLNAALQNAGFRQQFHETYAEIAEQCFAQDRVNRQIDLLAEQYRAPALATFARFYGGMKDPAAQFDRETDAVRGFFAERADVPLNLTE